jgi:RND family efflux transporter MFP subunit
MRMRTSARVWQWGGWLVLGVAGSAWAQAPGPASITPSIKPLAEEATVKGITRCAADLSLGLSVPGRIANLLVQEGTVVRPGEVLLHLDRGLEVQRRFAQWQGQAEMVTAKARVETALVQAEAARKIYQTNQGISREDLENRELALATTQSEVERLKTVKEIERLDYLTAKENLERRSLRAPTRGIVTKLIKFQGESLQANEAALRLCDISKVMFVVNVPAARTEKLVAGTMVEVLVGLDAAKTKGRLTFASPVVDAASGLREIKIELINPGVTVRPGVPASLDLSKL